MVLGENLCLCQLPVCAGSRRCLWLVGAELEARGRLLLCLHIAFPIVCLCPDGPFGIRTSVLWSSNDLVLNLITSVIVSLLIQRVKHLPAMRETWVQSLGQKDPLEEDMATHSSILA